ncbi:sigma factor [Streptomyces sp. NPDC058293]|uniref:sigma factor n=1 Tax=Streptomyces sp. NPDC058293 TaxID=3346429 RepID=UPI0036E656B5
MGRTAKGSQEAFAAVYDRVAGPVFGVVRSVLRDPAQSEEVAQEVLIEVWRSAARYRPDRGTAMNWVLTLAHRRAIDRVRSVEASAARERQAAILERTPEFKATLTKILTYHVVGQKLAPKDLENGSYTTLEKSKLTTAGSGESYKVNDSASVVCGNVKTANANVNIIDTVLMPK